MTPDIELRQVDFAFGEIPVLEDVSLVVPHGEFLGIVGPNGGGKTTLLKLVLGLLAPDRGEVRVCGLPPAEARSRIGYCPQYATFPRSFPITVAEAVLTGRLRPGLAPGRYAAADRAAAAEAMAACEIGALARRPLSALSGGQLQRVMVARALVGEPRLLLLDEPTASVDPRIEQDLFALLKTLNARMTIVVVTHDIGFVSQFVTRVACVNRTLVCHHPEHLTGEVIDGLYRAHVHLVHHHPHEHG